MTIVKQRDAAYRLVARAMLGEEWPEGLDEETFAYAVALILKDTRKSRSAGERSIQSNLATVAVVAQFTAHPDDITAAVEGARGILGDTLGHLLGDEVKPK